MRAAEVENVESTRSAIHGEQHRIHAFFAKQVGLGLPTVAQDLKLGWIATELVDEITYHSSAGLADFGSDNVGKTEDPTVHFEQMLKCPDHGFTAQLRRAIQRDGVGRVVFRDGLHLRNAVNSRGGGECQTPNSLATHAFKDVISAEDILVEVLV